jgi:EmrB/QacA subfamily drug resistance transporter
MLHNISRRQKVIVMLAVMSALFLFALDQLIITTALGKIVEEFNSFSSLSWIVTAYLLTSTLATPIAGKLSDMFGRRLVIMSGVSIFVVASFFAGSAASIEQLILWRAIQGIGGGVITANAFAIIGDLFTPRERGKWQGIFGGVFGIASVIGPLLGGFLTENHHVFGLTTNWRWTLWLNVPIGLIVLGIIAKFMPKIPREKHPHIDVVGAGLLSVILATIILAADNTDKIFADVMDSTGWSLAVVRIMLLTITAISLVTFVWWERSKAKEPILDLRFFKNHNFRLFMIMSLLNGAAFLGAILYVTQFNQQVFGVSPSTAGLMILPMVLGLTISAGICGQIMQRTGHYRMLMLGGMPIAIVGIFSLSFLTPTSPFWLESIIMVITGIGLGALLPTLNLAVQNEFAQKDLGIVSATTQLFRNLGSTVGTAIFGGILTAGIIAQLGTVSDIPYIRFLANQPSSSQNNFTSNLSSADADVALNLNMHDTKKKITDGFTAGLVSAQKKAETEVEQNIAAQPLPPEIKAKAEAKAKANIADKFESIKKDFNSKQRDFNHDVVYAFSDSLRVIFYSAAGLMTLAFIAGLFVHERELRQTNSMTTPAAH